MAVTVLGADGAGRKTSKPKGKTVQKRAFQDVVESYSGDYLPCRDFGHSWKPVTASKEPNGSIKRVLACARCETERHQILDRKGFVLSNFYTYANGYLIAGVGRLTVADKALLRITNILNMPES